MDDIDKLSLLTLANLLQLDESATSRLYWYNKTPVIISGIMCYQLNFKGDIESIILKQPNLIHSERISGYWGTAAYFKIPDL